METSRRKFLLGTSVVAGTASLVGYNDTLFHAMSMKDRGVKAKDAVYGNAANPECRIVGDEAKMNEEFSLIPSVCNGCTTHCSVRVKVDKKTQDIVRVFGNPYSLLSSDPWLPYKTPIVESFKALSGLNDSGLDMRSTVCARGNLIHEKLKDPFRVTTPLKRVGKRGEDKWVSISIEQLMKEIVEGGNLFGEGEVQGLQAFNDMTTPIDPNNPDYGPMANKLCIIGTANEGRQNYMVHRFVQAFGTINYMGHTANCGLSMRVAEGAYLNDLINQPHLKPDFEHCSYLLNIATAPAQAGNPFKRQAKLLAHARTEMNLHYTTVTPLLTNSDALAIGKRSSWVPIKPGGDLGLVMGMIRCIIKEERYNKEYLSIASEVAQEKRHDVSHTNASHLVISEGEKKGFFLLNDKKEPMVIDKADGTLKSAVDVLEADFAFEGDVMVGEKSLHVKSSFVLLKESALAMSLDEYSRESGISVKTIKKLAHEFTSHGRSVATDCHGGTMHSTGFYTAYAIMMLGALVGNLNYKGGMSGSGGKFKDYSGKQYDLLAYEGKRKPSGTRLDRTRKAYETSNEYKQKVAKGENPYPAKDNWYPFTNTLQSEIISSSANGYPYKMGALISWNANFVYGQSGSEHLIPLLKDPKIAVPLFIAIDPFINESSRYADYIVPDSVSFETWGIISPWAGFVTKANHTRFPIGGSPNAKFPNGEPISMDSFMIELGKALKLKGFGENAINGADGKKHAFNKPEDLYLRAFENVAMDGQAPAPEISDEEIKLSGIEPYTQRLQAICGENWRRVAFVMSRGGRFADKPTAYTGMKINSSYQKTIAMYNETVGTSFNSLTGERYSGVPRFYAPRLCTGEKIKTEEKGFDLLAFSYKSNVLSHADSALESLRQIRYTTYLDINSATAKNHGIHHGETVKLHSEGGTVTGVVRLREGVHPYSIGIEHGGGREAEGAVSVTIDGITKAGKIARKSGTAINKLGLKDSTRLGIATLSDFAIGSNARQAVPVRIEKIS